MTKQSRGVGVCEWVDKKNALELKWQVLSHLEFTFPWSACSPHVYVYRIASHYVKIEKKLIINTCDFIENGNMISWAARYVYIGDMGKSFDSSPWLWHGNKIVFEIRYIVFIVELLWWTSLLLGPNGRHGYSVPTAKSNRTFVLNQMTVVIL